MRIKQSDKKLIKKYARSFLNLSGIHSISFSSDVDKREFVFLDSINDMYFISLEDENVEIHLI